MLIYQHSMLKFILFLRFIDQVSCPSSQGQPCARLADVFVMSFGSTILNFRETVADPSSCSFTVSGLGASVISITKGF